MSLCVYILCSSWIWCSQSENIKVFPLVFVFKGSHSDLPSFSQEPTPSSDDSKDEKSSTSSLDNIIPMDKLKSGSVAAGKFFSSAFEKTKEVTIVGFEKTKEATKKIAESDTVKNAGTRIKSGSVYAWEKTVEGAVKAKDAIAPVAVQAGQSISAGAKVAGESISSGAKVAGDYIGKQIGGGGSGGSSSEGGGEGK
jgi:hypothetical protein